MSQAGRVAGLKLGPQPHCRAGVPSGGAVVLGHCMWAQPQRVEPHGRGRAAGMPQPLLGAQSRGHMWRGCSL